MKLTISGTALLKFACYMSLAISFLPVVDYYCPWYVTVIPVLIVLYVTLRKNGNIYPLMITALLILSLAALEYWVVYRKTSIVDYFLNFVISFIPCILTIQISRTVDNKRFYENYLKVTAIFTGITCITTIIGLNIYPMASRELASGTAIYDTSRYLQINIGGYEFIYALVLLIPMLFWLIKKANGTWRIVYTMVLILDLLCIYESQYTIALICVVISLIVLWMQFNKKEAGMVTGIIVIFVLLNGLSILSQVFYWASDVIEQEYVADRLLQVAQLLSGQPVDTDTSSERIEHYQNQISAFFSSPIWGHNMIQFYENRISGHSQILDMLGGAGILGLALSAACGRKLYRLTINPNRKAASPYIKATWTMLVIVACLNPVFFPIIATIMFMCCMCMYKVDSE